MANRKIRRIRSSKDGPTYVFNSSFEERKTCEYLRNLMHSVYLQKKSSGLLDFSAAILGKGIITDCIKREYQVNSRDLKKLEEWCIGRNDFPLPKHLTEDLLRRHIASRLEKRIKALSRGGASDVEKRLVELQKTFNLTDAERDLVAFFYMKRTCEMVREYLDNSSNVDDFSEMSKLRGHGDMLLGSTRAEFQKVFARGIIFNANLFERNHQRNTSMEIMSWNTDYLSGIGNTKLGTDFFDKKNDEQLKVNDFSITADELNVIGTVLKSKGGKNLLFYGTPGTGKTSFAKSLARKYGKELFSVKATETDDIKDRIRALYATINLANANKAIVLVDEADDILNTFSTMTFNNSTSKSWINTFMETHENKIIWITNRSSEIDPSTMRRFAFAVEFTKFDAKKRLKALKYALNKKGIAEGYFTDEELNGLCKNHAVNAGGIVNAIDAAAVTKRTNKDRALRRIKTVLKNHEKAIGAAGTEKRQQSFDQYMLDGLNASMDLHTLVKSIQKKQKTDSSRTQSISMLLHGKPGTGKSEFVGYLGHTLGKEVLLKRASDIQDKYVGEAEKNIANAFRDARERGLILLFDEADTFLFPRTQAQRSWEKSFTNEILTQLENHQGIVVFTTNDMDGLDHAALRRFGFKIRFDPLLPAGNQQFYESLLSPLVSGGCRLAQDEIARLQNIQNLTPGDFAVIKKQYTLLDTDGLTHRQLLAALETEVQYKKGSTKILGF